MTQIIHKFAQADTPSTVTVPNSKYGLIVWAVGRFGGAVIVCAIALYALNIVYANMMSLTDRMLVMLEQKAASESKLASTLESLTRMIENLDRDAKEAHRKELARPLNNER